MYYLGYVSGDSASPVSYPVTGSLRRRTLRLVHLSMALLDVESLSLLLTGASFNFLAVQDA